MISASEPQEYIPRGRQPMKYHPGPIRKEKPKPTLSEEMEMLQRMQSVTLTETEDEPSESYCLREVLIKDATDEGPEGNKLMPHLCCEEELYVRGHTAVWTSSTGTAPIGRPFKSYSIERPIKFAFFSPRCFLEPDTAAPGEQLDRNGICVVDDEVLHVYCDNGDTYGTRLDCPISAIWPTPFGLMFEKDPALSQVMNLPSEPMPRLFTVPYPTDEMKPVLIITSDIFFSCNYMCQPEHRVVFASDQAPMVLIYDKRERKHFICWMRLASEEEKATVQSSETDDSFLDDDGDEGYDMLFGNAGATGPYAFSAKRKSTPGASRTSFPNIPDRTSPLPPFDRFPAEFAGNPNGEGTSNNSPTSTSRVTPAVVTFLQSIGPWESLSLDPEPEAFDMRKVGFADNWKPIVPQFCLERIWKESISCGEMASLGFLHTDLVGSQYVCYLQPSITRLSLVHYELGTKAPKIVAHHILSACTAVALGRLNLIILLDPAGKLTLYSGPQVVGKVHVSVLPHTSFLSSTGFSASAGGLSGSTSSQRATSTWKRSSLLPNVAPSCDSKFEEELHLLSPVRGGSTTAGDGLARPDVQLCDGTGTRFTIAFGGGVTNDGGNGRSFRVALPPLAESQLLRRCLLALRHALPTKAAHDLLIRWYGTRNVPGTHAGFSIRQEWNMFQNLLLTALGRPIVSTDAPTDGSHQRPSASFGPNPSDCFLKKRRRRENTKGSDGDWEYLLAKVTSGPTPIAPTEGFGSPAGSGAGRAYKAVGPLSLYRHIPEVLQVLHLLYEDLKLDTGLTDELRLLGEFLFVLASDAQISRYQQHYFLDFPELCDRYRTNACRVEDHQLLDRIKVNSLRLPHIFRYLQALVQGRPELSGLQQAGDAPDAFVPYPYLDGINDRSRDVIVLVALMFRERRLTQWVQGQLDAVLSPERFNEQLARPLLDLSSVSAKPDCSSDLFGNTVLHFLIDRGYTRQRLEDMPVAVRFLMLQMLEQLRGFAKHGHDAAVYQMLLRPELHQHAVSAGTASRSTSLIDNPERRVIDWERSAELLHQWLTDMAEFDALTGIVNTKDDPQRLEREDGMDNLDVELLRLRFPHDRRIDDVRSFLTSSRRVLIDIPQGPNVSDHDFIEEQERRLYSLCLRTMAQPIGRGMFTFSTRYPSEAALAHIPRLCLTGREPLRGATIEVVQLEVPPHMNMWPLFHNGVAAGLRICPDTPGITSSWIINNRHACRRASSPTNSCPFSPGNEANAEHGGFLLALGLNGHLRQLSVYSIFDYMVRSHELMRIGMLLGLSAAYRGTEHQKTTCLLAVHVEALLPPTAVELDVTQTLQVAALFGIGLVHQGTAKRHITEVLLQEIGRPPGPEMENAVERESYALAAGLALGMVTLGRGDQLTGLRDLAIPGELYHYMTGGPRRLPVGAQREKYRMPSFQIREGDEVNLDVTAPGATLALGLMFFGTSDPTISGWLQPPGNKFLFEFVRPDMLLLRIIALHLICWDAVQPTQEWVTAQVPDILLDTVASVEGRTAEHLMVNPSLQPSLLRVERELYCQAHCVIVCGSVVGIGLRYAGTGDRVAANTIHHYLRYFISLRHLKVPPQQRGMSIAGNGEGKRSLAKLIGCQVLENCVLMTLLALSLVLAGTGDVRVLRTVRMLRSRIGVPGCTYGSHMATHMALGFVYLGGGRYTLSRSPPAIAAIVCAIFPKFPVYSNDNRYHLQALRHLYVLAVEPRLFVPRRIDTGRLTMCRIRYARRDQPAFCITTQMAPCMLPELHTLAWLEVCDENFYPIRFDADNWHLLENILTKRQYFDVTQYIGCLSYLEDPTRTITMHMQVLPGKGNNSWKVPAAQLLELESQPFVLFLTESLLLPPVRYRLRAAIEPTKNLPAADRAIHYFQMLVAHCVVYDRFHALSIMFELTRLLLDPHKYREHRATDTWQLQLLKSTLSSPLPILTESGQLFPGKLFRALVMRAHDGWAGDWRRYRSVLQNLCGIFFCANTSLFDRVCVLPLSIDADDDDDGEGSPIGVWPKVDRRTGILTDVARIAVRNELPLDVINQSRLVSLWPREKPSQVEFVLLLGLRHPELSRKAALCLANLLNLRE
uniref:Anaphase-promoting complex subunit 1 n=1 Tax=Anopheles atroparvus TaxID=41427 RepID=A0AAG5DRA5_ANOAO